MYKICFCLILLFTFLNAKPKQVIEELSKNAFLNFDILAPVKLSHHGQDYEIYIAKTKKEAKNYKVLYFTDADAFFPNFLNLYDKNDDLILVGIGYGKNLAFHKQKRMKDYTPKISGSEVGGGDKEFLVFLKEFLMPYIKDNFAINENYQGFFGHSFGGLFALNTLLKESSLFTHYFIISPSLWWGESAFLPTKLSLLNCPNIFLAKGSLEKNTHSLKDSKININDLATKLRQDSKCTINLHIFENESHGSVIKKAMKFSLDNF
ncbi:alpha/beta hydrolase [Campylobacter sp. LR264d]|uniref:alpha/beta hydrolase n=1 Tax=Campylobacter sp. LR264d TaxID=2593544 RepID=UPI00123B52C6|nr:alpha/beta hydrolase-fold protein [Campylobacter sp. LR264d]KAA6229849.1 alpha/beta hydrolase [Campylobacter sp. LR264d]